MRRVWSGLGEPGELSLSSVVGGPQIEPERNTQDVVTAACCCGV